jgi:hypothetical protein
MGKHGAKNPAEVYLGLRRLAFIGTLPNNAPAIDRQSVAQLVERLKGSESSHDQWMLWGALREQGHQPTPTERSQALVTICEHALFGATVTFVAHNDGNASMYLSTGGGIIGGKAHRTVRDAARALCATAETLAPTIPVAPDIPAPPSKGEFVVSLLTPSGMRVVRERIKSVRSKAHCLYPIYVAMHELITQIRRAKSGSSDNGSTDAGVYANCLLTLIAENQSGDVTITEGERVPDLLGLVRTSDQRDWICKEGLENAGSIDSKRLIKLLRRNCRFGLFRRRGTFQAKLVRGNGAIADFTFSVERSKDVVGRKTLRFQIGV